MAKKEPPKINKSAVNGKFVTDDAVKKDPDKTYTQTTKPKPKTGK